MARFARPSWDDRGEMPLSRAVPSPVRGQRLVDLSLGERYRPRSLKDIIGQSEAIQKLRLFAESWRGGTRPPRIRAALLEGVPGTGKTSAAWALAQDMGWGVIELNASDARNKTALEQVAGRAAITNTFTDDGRFLSVRQGQRTVILLDEADCLSTRPSRETEAGSKPPPASFREFLRTRYGRIEDLNRSWGLREGGDPPAYSSFESLPATVSSRARWWTNPAAQADLRDWRSGSTPRDYSDRGGLGVVVQLVRESLQPIILTVNDARPLTRAHPIFRQGVLRVRFYPVREEALKGLLHRIAVAEGLAVSDETIDFLASHAKGDVRAALNDLEALRALPPGESPAAALGYRDLASNLYEATHDWLSSARLWKNVEVIQRSDSPPEEILPWIEENIPRYAPGPKELSDAFRRLALADLWLSRASRRRLWSLWSYASEMMTGGVGLALHPEGPSGTGFERPAVEFPRFLAAMGASRNWRLLQRDLVEKLGHRVHVSRRRAPELVLPVIAGLFRGSPQSSLGHLEPFRVRLIRELELTPEEIATLLDQEPESPSVVHLVREAYPDLRESSSAPSGRTRAKGGRTQKKLF
jgi:DNA polymerase III delta prime subunit